MTQWIKATAVSNVPTDLLVVNAARVSMNKSSEFNTDGCLKEKDTKLLNYLAENGHWTPFAHSRVCIETRHTDTPLLYRPNSIPSNIRASMEHSEDWHKVKTSFYGWVQLIKGGYIHLEHKLSVGYNISELMPESSKAYGVWGCYPGWNNSVVVPQTQETDPKFIDVTMRESVPIFVARQRFKHALGWVYNEVSRRYVEDTPEFYSVPNWRERPQGSIKQGSGQGYITTMDKLDRTQGELWSTNIGDHIYSHNESCTHLYNDMVGAGVAPEQARMVLPQSMMTEYYATANLVYWNNAHSLRSDTHAQQEIQELATQWGSELYKLHTNIWRT